MQHSSRKLKKSGFIAVIVTLAIAVLSYSFTASAWFQNTITAQAQIVIWHRSIF